MKEKKEMQKMSDRDPFEVIIRVIERIIKSIRKEIYEGKENKS